MSISSVSTSSVHQDLEHHTLLLESLPEEILQLIVTHLSAPDLKSVALVSRTLNRHATDLLWQHVCLADKWKLHVNEVSQNVWSDRGRGESDEHDDTPIIQKLYIFATNPVIASKVHTLTHRCHLNPPNIFNELPRMYFDAANLSQDIRLYVLLHIAIKNLVNVHTLRIIYGHWRLTNELLVGFLRKDGAGPRSLRKLWLESCAASVDPMSFLLPEDTSGLESIRIRRLASESLDTVQRRGTSFLDYRLARSGQYYQLQNGVGNWIGTTVQVSEEDLPERWPRFSPNDLQQAATAYDDVIWDDLPSVKAYVDSNFVIPPIYTSSTSPIEPLDWLVRSSASTLTSLNLDWILWRRRENDEFDNSAATLNVLSQLRFPHLRAFQVRNAVLPHTRLPENMFLLEDDFLMFLENHMKLQCLGWPLDKFYSHSKPSIDIQSRSQKLVAHLATVLTDLRVDTQYGGHGEPFSDQSSDGQETQQRTRRRRFITEFAPHMRKIEQIKLEGGIPRDEKRELLRALHWCPLKKIVMIGVSFPAGNTWGSQGHLLRSLDPGTIGDYELEEEDLDGILATYRHGFNIPDMFTFEPNFGWPPQAPLLQTIALHHASTVEELKICGYNGCPILSFPTPITIPILNSLREYHTLKQLVISFWLLTWYEDNYRDTEIIQSWLDTRSPSSTALAVVTPPTSPAREHPVDPAQFPNFNHPRLVPRTQSFNRWAVELKTRFSPSALAYRVAQDIGRFLSPSAKARPGGVRVRASFCLGLREQSRSVNDIFDLDVRIGSRAGIDHVLEFTGPREDGEKGRWWAKLENRRWF
ncbi:hypothetical protein ACN47E_000197 [Coniothyrium glycines]